MVLLLDELSGEIFDLLYSLGDFMEFKDVMVAQKDLKKTTQRGPKSAGGLDLSVSGTAATGRKGGGGGGGGGGSGGLDLSIAGRQI